MAYWDRITSRGRVDDRRSMAPAAFGGLSVTGIALLFLFNYLTGGDMGDVLNQLQYAPPQQSQNTQEYDGNDPYEEFASTVLGSNNNTWNTLLTQHGTPYTEPTLVLFRTTTQSGCGGASSSVGPHYCPLDNTIYLDETFFDELTSRFGAQGGDVAQAYVIAHEVGHHVQNTLGIMNNINPSDNQASIRLELQADCFAGIWANSIKDAGVFEQGEIHEAMDAAAAVGDDRIQEKVTGRVDPENWTHGSSEQRLGWFNKGYTTGSIEACDTFN